MKVAIDGGPLSDENSFRGVGMFTRDYYEALKEIEARNPKAFSITLSNFEKTDLTKFDIAHYPNFNPYFLTLPQKRIAKKNIVTIHDLIYLVYPNAYPPGIKGAFKFYLQKFNLRNIDGVVTISETSKKDIVRFLGVSEKKIAVVYGGARKVFKPIHDSEALNTVKIKYKLPEKFVLYVGDVNFNKNINTLAAACVKNDITLVIAGKQAASTAGVNFDHPENASFREFIKKYQDNEKVMRLGFIPDEDLVIVYNLASVYCQPSFYEGLGLNVLEAFACETPVVIARTQALVEIAEGASLIADPYDSKDMGQKIMKLIESSSERVKLIRAGSEKLKIFNYQNSADIAYKFYKNVLES